MRYKCKGCGKFFTPEEYVGSGYLIKRKCPDCRNGVTKYDKKKENNQIFSSSTPQAHISQPNKL